jgi:hypothetical protein
MSSMTALVSGGVQSPASVMLPELELLPPLELELDPLSVLTVPPVSPPPLSAPLFVALELKQP